MLPVDFNPSLANPHEANYHLWTASGDADVDGSAGCDLCQTFHLHDRATRYPVFDRRPGHRPRLVPRCRRLGRVRRAVPDQ